MDNLANEFERLFSEAYSEDLYKADLLKYGHNATMAGIEMSKRIEALTEFVRTRGKQIAAVLNAS